MYSHNEYRSNREFFKPKDRARQKEIGDAFASFPIEVKPTLSKGDCFFDAVARGIEANLIAIPENLRVFFQQHPPHKALRMICRHYAIQNKKDNSETWRETWLGRLFLEEVGDIKQLQKKHAAAAEEDSLLQQKCNESIEILWRKAADQYNQYIIHIQNSNADAIKFNNTAIWGRPDREGRIFCELFNIKLHNVEFQDAEENHIDDIQNKIIPTHLLQHPNGRMGTISAVDVDYSDPSVVHIAVHREHYVSMISLHNHLHLLLNILLILQNNGGMMPSQHVPNVALKELEEKEQEKPRNMVVLNNTLPAPVHPAPQSAATRMSHASGLQFFHQEQPSQKQPVPVPAKSMVPPKKRTPTVEERAAEEALKAMEKAQKKAEVERMLTNGEELKLKEYLDWETPSNAVCADMLCDLVSKLGNYFSQEGNKSPKQAIRMTELLIKAGALEGSEQQLLIIKNRLETYQNSDSSEEIANAIKRLIEMEEQNREELLAQEIAEAEEAEFLEENEQSDGWLNAELFAQDDAAVAQIEDLDSDMLDDQESLFRMKG